MNWLTVAMLGGALGGSSWFNFEKIWECEGLRAEIDTLERRQEELESELARADRHAQVSRLALDFIVRLDTGDQWNRQLNELRDKLVELGLYKPPEF